MKNIIFFDVDGTLLDHSIGMDNVPDQTKKAIELLDKTGNYCIVATARTNLTEELKKLPDKPGVYIMHDNLGKI